MKTRQDIQDLLKLFPHYFQVRFALYCCNDIKDLITDKRSLSALEMIEKWLNNPKSVSNQELINATFAAYAAANAAHAAAANTAYAAYAAVVNKKIDKYYWDLVEMTKEISSLEKVIYGIE